MKKNDASKLHAVALAYKRGQEKDPYVVAKGKGEVAKQIIERASDEGIPVQRDENLVQLLGALELKEAIPETLYQAVAEVFTLMYKMDQRLKEEQ